MSFHVVFLSSSFSRRRPQKKNLTSIERDLRRSIPLAHALQLRHIFIPVLGLVEPKRPQRRHRGPAHKPRQLLDDGRGRGACQKIQIQNPTGRPEREPRVRRQHRVHRVRVPQQEAVRRAVPAELQHERKRPVEVEVRVVCAVAVPQGERATGAAEGETCGRNALSEAEKSRVRGDPGGDLEVLVLEDQAQARGVEEG